MVNRNDIDTLRRTDKVHESDSPAIRSISSRRDTPKNDDIIMSLANSYENKRARQVTEWEMMRRTTRLAS